MYMVTTGQEREGIGQCPNCDVALNEAQVLIEYERSGSESVYADCRRCGDVVHPV